MRNIGCQALSRNLEVPPGGSSECSVELKNFPEGLFILFQSGAGRFEAPEKGMIFESTEDFYQYTDRKRRL